MPGPVDTDLGTPWRISSSRTAGHALCPTTEDVTRNAAQSAFHEIVRSRDKIQPGTVGLLPLLMRLAPSYAARRVAST